MRSHGNKIVEPPTASPKPMTGPHFGMIPRRVAKLRLPGRVHAVLDVIACHANPKKGNRAYLRRDTIANEAGIDCSKVSFCTRACRQISQIVAAARWSAARKFRAVLS
jgi:hypothetical protein